MMKITGVILMLIGALYHQFCWMPAVLVAGLVVFVLGIERSILTKIETVQDALREQAVSTIIEQYQKEPSPPEPETSGDANKPAGR